VREVVQAAEVLHQLHHVGHLPASVFHRGADAVQHEPALRQDRAFLQVGAELAAAADGVGRLGRDVVVAAHDELRAGSTAITPDSRIRSPARRQAA
jgi:hypothetical protein